MTSTRVEPPDRRARWAAVSARLDELLDLEPGPRARRLDELKAQDPELHAELQRLLAELPRIEQEDFLEQPALQAPPPPLLGRAIGPYTLERELGEGGMGSVWLARRTDGRYDGCVAVKFLHGGLFGAAAAERFAHEGRILGRLTHPNIARLLDAGVLDGVRPYLMLEYVDGLPIDWHCERQQLDLAARLALFLDVLAAVAHAHQRLILHRDLKPSNILVTADGQVKLLDFGIAKLLDDEGRSAELTQRAGRAFTPQYAAPEQLQGEEVTTATDVYALGVLLYRLLSGAHPTADPTTPVLDQMRSVVEAEPARLSEAVLKAGGADARRRARALRGDLDNIVAKALRKAPTERYANAEAFAEDLRRHLRHEPVQARPDRLGYRLAKFLRRYRLAVGATAVTVAALAAGIGVAVWQAQAARAEHAKAEGLVEFMLGDLRQRLQPVGRLDVLDAVGERALAHYESQDLAGLSADALGRRARALHLMGEIAEQRGQLAEAERMLRRAADSTAALLARAPRDGQRVFDHAQSVYWVGTITRARGETARAVASFREYLALAERLVGLDPSRPEWRAEEAMAANNLGVVLLDAGQARDALLQLDRSRRAWDAVVRERPAFHLDLAHTWGWIAKAHEALDDSEAALRALDAKLRTLPSIDERGGNREADLLRSTTHYDIAMLALQAGDADRAERAAAAGVAVMQRLVALDPANLNWLQRLARQRLLLAEAQWAGGRRGQALQDWPALVKQVETLLQRADGGNVVLALRLAGARWVMQERLQGRLPVEAMTRYFASAAAFEAAGALDQPDNRRLLASVRMAAAQAAAAAGRRQEAQEHWGEVLRLVPAAAPSPALSALRAHALLHTGQRAEALVLAQRIPPTHRLPVIADLRQRLAATGSATAATP